MAVKKKAANRYYVVNRPMGYAGKDLDRGQVFLLVGARNDEKLIRLNYVRELTPRDSTATCGGCQQRFVGDRERDAHFENRHDRQRRALFAARPDLEEQHQEREEKILDEVAPLRMDRTAATLAGRAPSKRGR